MALFEHLLPGGHLFAPQNDGRWGNLREKIATWQFLRRNIGRQFKIGCLPAANSSERLQSHKLLFHPVCRSSTFIHPQENNSAGALATWQFRRASDSLTVLLTSKS
jgi:hypothetical protein